MKVVIFNGIIDPSAFEVVEVKSRDDIIGRNVVGIYPNEVPPKSNNQLLKDIVRRIHSRLGAFVGRKPEPPKKPKVYEPKEVVEITPERMKELMEEGARFAAEIKKQTDQMTYLTPEDWKRVVK